MLFWPPPSRFSQWFPSSFAVDNVSYSCAEQFTIAEKARLFQDHREWSPLRLRQTHACKSVSGEAYNFDSVVWDRVRTNVAYARTFAKFTQNPTMKKHLLSTGTKILAEASPLDTGWGIGARADDPETRDPDRWRGTICSRENYLAVRDAIRTR